MENIWVRFNAFRKKHFVTIGFPILVIVFGGSFYLEQFSKLRYQFGRQSSLVSPAELKKQGIEVKDRSEVTLEAQYEKIKELNIDDWEPVRISRPWEENEAAAASQ